MRGRGGDRQTDRQSDRHTNSKIDRHTDRRVSESQNLKGLREREIERETSDFRLQILYFATVKSI